MSFDFDVLRGEERRIHGRLHDFSSAIYATDLRDPAYADLSISAIASRWGLPSAPHFSRLFRVAYGCSPREFRRAADDDATRRSSTGRAKPVRPAPWPPNIVRPLTVPTPTKATSAAKVDQ